MEPQIILRDNCTIICFRDTSLRITIAASSLSTIGKSESRKKVVWQIRYNLTSQRSYVSVVSKTFGDKLFAKLKIFLTFSDSPLWGGLWASFCKQLDERWDVKIFLQLSKDCEETLKCVAQIRTGKCVTEKYSWSLWWRFSRQSVSSRCRSSSAVAVSSIPTCRKSLIVQWGQKFPGKQIRLFNTNWGVAKIWIISLFVSPISLLSKVKSHRWDAVNSVKSL